MAYLRHEKFLRQLGENIRKLRIARNLSQADLAYEADTSVNQISRLELGKINAGASLLYAIAKALKVEVKDLFDF